MGRVGEGVIVWFLVDENLMIEFGVVETLETPSEHKVQAFCLKSIVKVRTAFTTKPPFGPCGRVVDLDRRALIEADARPAAERHEWSATPTTTGLAMACGNFVVVECGSELTGATETFAGVCLLEHGVLPLS